MKILFILGEYKPKMSASGLCSDNVIQSLIKSGHQVTALVNSHPGCENEEQHGELKVHRVKNRLYMRLQRKSEYCNKSIKAKFYRTLSGLTSRVQLFAMLPAWPRVDFPAQSRFTKAALELHEKNKYDVIISSYSPIEALLAGYEVKKKHPEVKYIPYFLDSFSGGYNLSYLKSSTCLERKLKIERKIFPLAERIVIMRSSIEHNKKHNSEFYDKMCVLDIPMFKKTSVEISDIKENNDKIKMLFIGSIVPSIRNPDTLIKLLGGLKDENIECEFIGNISCIERFEELKSKMGDRLKLSGFMTHDKVMEKISEADFLLNIGNLVTTMVPSKIFEYMSYGKPIISTYDIDNEPSYVYLSDYPLAYLADGRKNMDENIEGLNRFIAEKRGERLTFDELKSKFYENTPEAFVECVINKLESKND